MNYWLLKRIGATPLLMMGLVEPLVGVALVLDVFRPPAVEPARL